MAEKMVTSVNPNKLGILSEVEKGSPLGYYFAFLIVLFVSGTYIFINFGGFLPREDLLITVICDSLLALGTFMFFITSLVSYFKSKNLRIRPGIIAFAVSSLSFFIAGGIGTWYNLVLQKAIPYPSVADIFYLIGSFALIMAIYYMTRTLNVKLGLKVGMNVVVVFLAVFATAAIVVSYAAFTNVFSDGLGVRALFSIAYPVLDIICLAMVANLILLSFGRSVFEAQVVLAIGACIMCVSHIYISVIMAVSLYHYSTLFVTLSAIAYMMYAMGVSRYVDLTKFDIISDRLAKLANKL